MTALRPLYAWRIQLRLPSLRIDLVVVDELQVRLHGYGAHVRLEGDDLLVDMRIVGHYGPASAVGDAQQAVTGNAVRLGVRGARVDVVHAERIELRAPHR